MSRMHAAVFRLALPVLIFAACGSVSAAEPSKAKRECVNKRDINVLRPLDDKHVFVRLGANRNYVFTTSARCHGLSLARRLSIQDPAPRVCSDGSSLFAFEHATVGSMRCRIAKIESVRDLAAAEEMLKAEVPPG